MLIKVSNKCCQCSTGTSAVISNWIDLEGGGFNRTRIKLCILRIDRGILGMDMRQRDDLLSNID